MSDKEVMPTPERLAELREQGLVPYSNFTTTCGVTVAVVVSLLMVKQDFVSFWDLFTQEFKRVGDGSSQQFLPFSKSLKEPLLRILLVPLAAGCICAFFVGLLQTRFLIRAIGADPDKGTSGHSLRTVLRNLMVMPLGILILPWVGILAAQFLARDLLQVLNNDASYLSLWLSGLSGTVVAFLCFVLLIAGILSWLITRYLFMREHRMSAREGRY